jgi:hypothetical protein
MGEGLQAHGIAFLFTVTVIPLFSILPRLVRESRVYIAKLHEHDSASHVP